ncbi:MAG: O-methyltransferase [Planctomycetes bacterium]|nr:O-methyltransferase [Planctomycetota bacterium]
MSHTSTRVHAEHFQYLAERTSGDDTFLTELKAAAAQEGIPAIWVAPEQNSFLAILLRLIGAKEVVEVGTLAGYSAIGMARALPKDGRLRTIELSPKHAKFARDWVAKSDVSEVVQVLEGSGRELLPTFADNSVDAVFLDADKAGYPGYITEAMRFVRPGGLIMADNAFAFGQLFDENPTDPEVSAVKAFNDFIPTVKNLEAVIVPMGDGVWVGVKTE